MKRKRKKVIKMRGSKTHGHGAKKKYRGKGSRGGKGYAGSKKHRKTYILRYEKEHLGKRGFKSKTRKSVRTINIKDVERIAEEKGTNKINLTELGYEKVLGKGSLTKPLVIEAKSFSDNARLKIEKAKGKAIIV